MCVILREGEREKRKRGEGVSMGGKEPVCVFATERERKRASECVCVCQLARGSEAASEWPHALLAAVSRSALSSVETPVGLPCILFWAGQKSKGLKEKGAGPQHSEGKKPCKNVPYLYGKKQKVASDRKFCLYLVIGYLSFISVSVSDTSRDSCPLFLSHDLCC